MKVRNPARDTDTRALELHTIPTCWSSTASPNCTVLQRKFLHAVQQMSRYKTENLLKRKKIRTTHFSKFFSSTPQIFTVLSAEAVAIFLPQGDHANPNTLPEWAAGVSNLECLTNSRRIFTRPIHLEGRIHKLCNLCTLNSFEEDHLKSYSKFNYVKHTRNSIMWRQ